jgi:hypothetical protein
MKNIILFVLLVAVGTVCFHLVFSQGVNYWHMLSGVIYGFLLKWYNES